jgi:hypothetical protein
MDRALVIPSLQSTPTLLRALAGDATEAQAATAPKPGEWSMVEVVRHLVQGDRDTFLPRLRRMLAEDRPRFEGARDASGDRADLAVLLDAFAAARREAVRILASLDEAGWRREGVSPSRGPLSVETYAQTMAEHDTEHLRQIAALRDHLGLAPKRCEARLALPLAEIAGAIEGTASTIERTVAGLSAARLRTRPRPDDWSAKEVMAHLLKVERDVFLPRLQRIVREERPVFEVFDPDAWARERDHREGDFGAELAAFAAVRGETVALLRSVAPAVADRIGLSGHFGPVTFAQFASHVVDHDIEHLTQLRADVAAAR